MEQRRRMPPSTEAWVVENQTGSAQHPVERPAGEQFLNTILWRSTSGSELG
jgi:hypothetical protein